MYNRTGQRAGADPIPSPVGQSQVPHHACRTWVDRTWTDRTWTLCSPCFRYQVGPHPKEAASFYSQPSLLVGLWHHLPRAGYPRLILCHLREMGKRDLQDREPLMQPGQATHALGLCRFVTSPVRMDDSLKEHLEHSGSKSIPSFHFSLLPLPPIPSPAFELGSAITFHQGTGSSANLPPEPKLLKHHFMDKSRVFPRHKAALK